MVWEKRKVTDSVCEVFMCFMFLIQSKLWVTCSERNQNKIIDMFGDKCSCILAMSVWSRSMCLLISWDYFSTVGGGGGFLTNK